MEKKYKMPPVSREKNGAKKKISVKSMDALSQLAMNIALWTAPEQEQERTFAYLHQLSVVSPDELVSSSFSHVCENLEDVYTFSFVFLKTVIEESRPKQVDQKIQDGILEIDFSDELQIRMSFTRIS
ncbi:MAG: hypothetical protein ILP13_08035 [Lachnospiraceae bacterium]|nr:hypothetical protein [Lachnospiraceae bacterium]